MQPVARGWHAGGSACKLRHIKHFATDTMTELHATLRRALLAAMLGAALGAQAAEPAGSADSGFSAGLNIQAKVSPEQLALPYYPGALPWVEKEDDKPGASIGAWGGLFGLQLHAMKLKSTASPDTVAQWYREQLSRLGPVLDCSHGRAADPPPLPDKKADKKLLRCGDDRAPAGGALYKLGTRADARVVSIAPLDGGTRIALVRVTVKGDD